MTEHTPGPWTANLHHVQECGGRSHAFVTAGAATPLAAVVLGAEGCSQKEGRANARLIAAAPDLLEALKLARECISYCRRAHKDAQSGEGIPVELFLDAAIAKATSASGVSSRPTNSGTNKTAPPGA